MLIALFMKISVLNESCNFYLFEIIYITIYEVVLIVLLILYYNFNEVALSLMWAFIHLPLTIINWLCCPVRMSIMLRNECWIRLHLNQHSFLSIRSTNCFLDISQHSYNNVGFVFSQVWNIWIIENHCNCVRLRYSCSYMHWCYHWFGSD